ncbi:unnamed protein product [Pylaiella littoralis]
MESKVKRDQRAMVIAQVFYSLSDFWFGKRVQCTLLRDTEMFAEQFYRLSSMKSQLQRHRSLVVRWLLSLQILVYHSSIFESISNVLLYAVKTLPRYCRWARSEVRQLAWP